MVIAESVSVINKYRHIVGLGNLSMVRFLLAWSLTISARIKSA